MNGLKKTGRGAIWQDGKSQQPYQKKQGIVSASRWSDTEHSPFEHHILEADDLPQGAPKLPAFAPQSCPAPFRSLPLKVAWPIQSDICRYMPIEPQWLAYVSALGAPLRVTN